MGMARGGVPVAFEVAAALDAPLDVVVVRKLGHPRQPELGLGAIGEEGVRLVNDALVAPSPGARGRDRRRRGRQTLELERRLRVYRGDRSPVPVEGRTAIVVDDGLATGFTARAAIEVMRSPGRGAGGPGRPRGAARRRWTRCATSPTTSCASRRPSGSSA